MIYFKEKLAQFFWWEIFPTCGTNASIILNILISWWCKYITESQFIYSLICFSFFFFRSKYTDNSYFNEVLYICVRFAYRESTTRIATQRKTNDRRRFDKGVGKGWRGLWRPMILITSNTICPPQVVARPNERGKNLSSCSYSGKQLGEQLVSNCYLCRYGLTTLCNHIKHKIRWKHRQSHYSRLHV